MYNEAAPFLPPDMSNYYRLLREAALRDRLNSLYPGLDTRLDAHFRTAAAHSFFQALPQRINPHEHTRAAVRPGVIPRGIEITNSIIERKILLRRLAEACLNPVPDSAAIAAIEAEISKYAAHLDINAELVQLAIDTTKTMASRLKTGNILTVVPTSP